jgi:hypothetical protein
LSKHALVDVYIPLVRYIAERTTPESFLNAVPNLLRKRAIETTVDYAEEQMSSALMFDTTRSLWDYALSQISLQGTAVEFGVFRGKSINYFAKYFPSVYGFDSFIGLHEDWTGTCLPKGSFDLEGKLPKVADNVTLIKGWFDDTVPPFLAQHPQPFSFVHIDCDTFEATEIVLRLLDPQLVAGTIIIFDEYFGYHGWQKGEYKAWQEYVVRAGIAYEYIAFASQQVAVRLK